MTSHREHADADAGHRSPVFLGAILGAVPPVNGDPVAGLVGAYLQAWAASALGEVVDRPTRITPLPSTAAPADFVLACRFTFATTSDPCTLLLDEAAARAIVTPLLADHLSVRGAGLLLETERGILEYAIEAWADGVAHRLGDAAGGPLIGSFDHEPNRKRSDPFERTYLHRQLVIPPNQGVLTVAVPASLEPGRLVSGVHLSHGDPVDEAWLTRVCTVRVALGPISVDDLDFASIEPGDALLLGRTSLEHLSAAATLCSDSGWTIGRVEVRHDSAATLSVALLDVDPRPQPTDARSAVLYPLVGTLELTGAQVSALRPGTVLDLTRRGTAPVLLRCGGDDIARGELVTARGEIAVRITELCSADRAS